MGGGCSTPHYTPAQREAYRRKKELSAQARRKKKQDKQARKDALKREQDAWIRRYRARLERKWYHMGWWPFYEWWKEKSAWEEHVQWKKKEGLIDSEGVPLKAHYD
jgi:hypothetical protein